MGWYEMEEDEKFDVYASSSDHVESCKFGTKEKQILVGGPQYSVGQCVCVFQQRATQTLDVYYLGRTLQFSSYSFFNEILMTVNPKYTEACLY